MPARSERIYVFPDQSGQPGSIMRFPVWWDRSKFFTRYSHREIDLGNPIDANFVFVLTSAEAIAWNKECVEQFYLNSNNSNTSVVHDMSQLESYLMNASWVIVESYEWESGLD